MQESDVIDMLRGVWEEVADPLAALTVLLELPARLDDTALVLVSAASECLDRDRLIVAALHVRLVIESVDLTHSSRTEDLNHTFRLGSVMRLGEAFAVQHGRQREATKSARSGLEKLSSRREHVSRHTETRLH